MKCKIQDKIDMNRWNEKGNKNSRRRGVCVGICPRLCSSAARTGREGSKIPNTKDKNPRYKYKSQNVKYTYTIHNTNTSVSVFVQGYVLVYSQDMGGGLSRATSHLCKYK